MTVKGEDWASYQSSTPSTKGLDFAFIKATEGRSYVNPRMGSQASTARKAGLVVGFYHFLHPGSVKAQAAYFVDKAASLQGDPLFADWETVPGGGAASSAEKDAFVREVQRLRGDDHQVGLYCNRDYWLNHDVTSFAGDALWIADYVTPGKPRIKAHWLFHQYTSAPVDTNVGNFKNRAALRSWAGGAPSTPEDDDMPIRTSLGLTKAQPLRWSVWTHLQWDREYADPKDAHGEGTFPGYVAPVESWADFGGRIVVDGLTTSDQLQVEYQVHDWKDGESDGVWDEIIADHLATPGRQFVSVPFSKGLRKGQHVYVAVKPVPGPGHNGEPVPEVTGGRWTIRQDRT